MIIYLSVAAKQIAHVDAIVLTLDGVEKRLEWDETMRVPGLALSHYKLKGVYYVKEDGSEDYANNSLAQDSKIENIKLLWEEDDEIEYEIISFMIEDNETMIIVKGENYEELPD